MMKNRNNILKSLKFSPLPCWSYHLHTKPDAFIHSGLIFVTERMERKRKKLIVCEMCNGVICLDLETWDSLQSKSIPVLLALAWYTKKPGDFITQNPPASAQGGRRSCNLLHWRKRRIQFHLFPNWMVAIKEKHEHKPAGGLLQLFSPGWGVQSAQRSQVLKEFCATLTSKWLHTQSYNSQKLQDPENIFSRTPWGPAMKALSSSPHSTAVLASSGFCNEIP